MMNQFPSELKTCFKCGDSLPRTEFYKHAQMADGLLGKCKKCTKNDSTARRWNKIEEIREYDRQRGRTKPHREKVRKYSHEHPEQICTYKNVYRQKYPQRTAARNAVSNAVRDGHLVKQPCEVCNDTNSEGHHDDYSKPLQVRWLCDFHHKQHHLTIREQERKMNVNDQTRRTD